MNELSTSILIRVIFGASLIGWFIAEVIIYLVKG